ncbi:MAG: glutamate--tRNA ligase [Planctomycetes bacterium]|nr:glutamate--tRNA ligase [Planctomycetota bacterium]
MTSPARTRIAPSPTGDPHVGTAYVAIFNRALARQTGGQFLLRIEDTDRERSSPASEAMILSSLRWLELDWDEGPDCGGPHGPYRQSERLEIYREHARRLVDGGQAYPCFCTPERLAELRARQKAEGLDHVGYDGCCRELGRAAAAEKIRAGAPHVIRLRVPDAGETVFRDDLRGEFTFQNRLLDDQVLVKSDGYPTYHLANVVDDHLMGITHVIRAEEWLSSVPKHVLLYRALGYPMPHLLHLPLLRNPDRSKISKRKNPVSIAWYRAQGYLPEALVNFLALMGFSLPDGRELFSFPDLVEALDLGRLNASAAPVFNLEKLDWMNGEYIRALPLKELAARVRAFGVPPEREARLAEILPLLRERLKTLAEVAPRSDFFFADPAGYDPALLVPRKCDREFARAVLEAFPHYLEAVGPAFEAAALEAAVDRLAAERGLKRGNVFMVLRVAVTGSTATPPLVESMAVLGREAVLRRVGAAARRLAGEP